MADAEKLTVEQYVQRVTWLQFGITWTLTVDGKYTSIDLLPDSDSAGMVIDGQWIAWNQLDRRNSVIGSGTFLEAKRAAEQLPPRSRVRAPRNEDTERCRRQEGAVPRLPEGRDRSAVWRNMSTLEVQRSTDTRIVIVETPYAGNVDRNVVYAKAAMLDCLERNEWPFASHLLYPQVLDDTNPDERAMGIQAGFGIAAALGYQAKRVVYYDLGVSAGMRSGIEHAALNHQEIEFRSLPGWAAK